MNITIILTAVFFVIILAIYIILTSKHNSEVKSLNKKLKSMLNQKDYNDEARITYSKNHEIIFANKSAQKLLYLENKEKHYLFKKDVLFHMPTSAHIELLNAIDKKIKIEKDNFHLNNSILIIDGNEMVVNIYVDISDLDESGTISLFLSENREIKEVIKQDGKIDYLTGLPSQFSALSDINSLVLDSQKKSETFSLFLFGVDSYADKEAILGKSYINQMMKNMANYFEYKHSTYSKIYKMDCDKFLFIVKSVKDKEAAYKIANQIIDDISENCKNDSNTHVTVSCGIVFFPKDGENSTKLIDNCYSALNLAQNDSSSTVKIFKSKSNTLHNNDKQMNLDMINALKNREFLLHYQPIFNLKTNEMISAEALIRWNHPKEGLISPFRFLELAEKTGLIVELGAYVFREAIKQRKQWDILGFPKFNITINLSLQEIKIDKLINQINILFDEYSVDPMYFNLDISETSAMENIEKTQKKFQVFKEAGLSITLDNFGSGLSSIKSLHSLPISMLKIDRSLIFDIATNSNSQTVVKAIIDLAHSLGYEVVAEGVELENEVDILKSLNCDHAQGYLFSKPVPVFEFQEILRKL